MRSVTRAVAVCLVFGMSVSIVGFPTGVSGARPSGPIIFLDADENVIPDVDFSTSYNQTTHSLKVRIESEVAIAMLANQSWVDSLVPDVALENVSYSLSDWDSRAWYRVQLDAGITYIDMQRFAPPRDRSVFSRGSPSSVLLERAMFIRLHAEPVQHERWQNASNANGTWEYRSTITDGRLVLNFTDKNTTGQAVRVNASWLLSYGIGQPSFLLSGGEDIPFERVGDHYVLTPPHFSFIYVFASYEHFRKETDFQYSEVYWDQGPQNIFLRSDRRDTGDEWFTRPLPQEIESTTSFTLSATWSPTLQGNYQIVTPLFLASSRDVSALQPSGLYFWYYSRNSVSTPPCPDCNPKYYLFYYDRTGTARIYDLTFEGGRNVAYKFYATYSATTKVLTMQIRTTANAVLHSVSYTIGTNAGDDFFFGKIGVGSEDGTEDTSEPVAEGRVDNIDLTLGSIVNPSVELDTNGDGVPDGWHNVWSFAGRSYERSHSGAWSVKIDDPDPSNGGGMETDDMPGSPGRYYRAVAYARVASGGFQLSLRFFDGSGAALSVATVSVGTTDTYWRRVYVDAVAPPGTLTVRVMAWSLTTNVGLAYFDSFYLVNSKLDNAGFEEAIGTMPTHWSSPNVVPTVDRVHVRTGTYSLRLVDLSASNPSPVIYSDPYPCTGGARHHGAGWLYVESEQGDERPFTLSLVFYLSSGQTTSYRVHGAAVGMWDYLAVEAIAPPDCVDVRIQFTSSQVNIGIADLDDVELLLSPPGLETDSSVWAITVHGTPGGVDSLGPTSDLGASHERWDWVWVWFEPNPYAYDWTLIAQRRIYLRSAAQVGIDAVVIVGGSLATSTPSWVTEANFAVYWNDFCEVIGQEFGAFVYWYQLANEQNWFFLGRFNSITVFNECFDGLQRGENGGQSLGYDHTWYFRSIINALTSVEYWDLFLELSLDSAGTSIDVVAIDHYPAFSNDWSAMGTLQSIVEAYGKLAGIMETGMYSGFPCSEACQSGWIANNIRDQMRPTAATWNSDHHNSRYVLFGWYKLRDGGDTYGLQRQDGSQKPAYATFRAEAYQYVGPPFYS